MTTAQTNAAGDSETSAASGRGRRELIVDIDAIDLDAAVAGRAEIEEWIPHRGQMALLDRIVWCDEMLSSGVAAWQVRNDEFWVPGHFPNHAMLPGVLQVEAGAQLSCYLYNRSFSSTQVAAFLRIENAVFRSSVEPGMTLYLLCKEVKKSRRRFISQIQGVVRDGGEGGERIAFEATIHGMQLGSERMSG